MRRASGLGSEQAAATWAAASERAGSRAVGLGAEHRGQRREAGTVAEALGVLEGVDALAEADHEPVDPLVECGILGVARHDRLGRDFHPGAIGAPPVSIEVRSPRIALGAFAEDAPRERARRRARGVGRTAVRSSATSRGAPARAARPAPSGPRPRRSAARGGRVPRACSSATSAGRARGARRRRARRASRPAALRRPGRRPARGAGARTAAARGRAARGAPPPRARARPRRARRARGRARTPRRRRRARPARAALERARELGGERVAPPPSAPTPRQPATSSFAKRRPPLRIARRCVRRRAARAPAVRPARPPERAARVTPRAARGAGIRGDEARAVREARGRQLALELRELPRDRVVRRRARAASRARSR